MPDKKRRIVVRPVHQRQTPPGEPLDPRETRKAAAEITRGFTPWWRAFQAWRAEMAARHNGIRYKAEQL